jgi:hypothetical protein
MQLERPEDEAGKMLWNENPRSCEPFSQPS